MFPDRPEVVAASHQRNAPTGLVQTGPDATADRTGANEHIAGHGDHATGAGSRDRIAPGATTRISGMSVPLVFALLLIAGVVVIGLLMLVALAVVLRSSPDAPANG